MILIITAEEFNILLSLTLILLIGKAILVLFLLYKIIERKKKTGEFSIGFVFGVFIIILFLLISRIFYSFFDFYFTAFDSAKFHELPNIIFWKIGAAISILGYSIFLDITDRKVLDSKLKRIPGIILIIIILVIIFFPITTAEEFQMISTLTLFANLVAIIIPVVFINLARKKSPFRMVSLAIALGVIIYAIGANITVEVLINAMASVLGGSVRISLFTLSLILKLTGLALFAYGVTKFAIKFSKD